MILGEQNVPLRQDHWLGKGWLDFTKPVALFFTFGSLF
jgi:hypothetical protein